MTDRDDDVAKRFRTKMDQRHFVDHEPGVLLIWVPVEREGLAELIPQVEARHPGARFAVRRTGSATALQVTAREEVLATITKLYIEVAAGPGARPDRRMVGVISRLTRQRTTHVTVWSSGPTSPAAGGRDRLVTAPRRGNCITLAFAWWPSSGTEREWHTRSGRPAAGTGLAAIEVTGPLESVGEVFTLT